MLSLQSLLPFSLLTSFGILVCGFVLYYIGWIVYSRFFHPYHDIPGPFLASVTQWWYFRSIRYGIGENTQLPLHKKYGPIVRIGPNDVSIASASALDTIYGADPIWEKTEFYDSFSPMIGNRIDTFTVRDEKLHASARKKIGGLFSPGAVLEYEPCVDRIIDIFMDCMEDFAARKEVIDISVWFRKYTFDAIGELFYGKEGGFGFLKENRDVNNWMSMLDGMVPIVSSMGYIPKGMKILYLMSHMIFPGVRKGLASANLVIEQSQTVVKDREAAMADGSYKGKNDMLAKMMAIVQERGAKIDFTNEDVATNVWVMIWAGSDTTGYSMSGIFYHVLKNPAVYQKLVAEVQEAFKNGKLSFPIRYNDAIKLPYLNACVKEGMRMSPATGTGFPRYVPPTGATVNGRFYPGGRGLKVTCNPNVTNFDKECFGDDADTFKPERWLQPDEKKVASMGRHELGFGIGPRVCLGKSVVMVEMYKLIPAIINKYDFELTVPEWKVVNCWFRCPSDVLVKVTKR